MSIELGMTHKVSYEDFYAEYSAAHDALENNLAKSYFIHAVFGMLRRSSEQSNDLEVCYNSARSEDQKLAAILVSNASIFNDTGWPDVTDED
ncbi:hypothetical protein ACOB6L_004634 [Salmonella enterica subsp. enterica serovar Typhimurium]